MPLKGENIQICQTTLAEKTDALEQQYKYKRKSDAFLALAVGIVLGIEPEDIEEEEIIEGSGEKQIDFIRIEDNPDSSSASIKILQVKQEKGFKSNTVILLKNGIDWIFSKPQREYEKLINQKFKNKIGEIRDLRTKYGTSALDINLYYVTIGDSSITSKEFNDERDGLIDIYNNSGFRDFDFKIIGAKELFTIQNARERAARSINYDLPIEYSPNIPSVIEYTGKNTEKTRSVVCSVSGKELARLADSVQGDFVFDLNLRPFLGTVGKVNQEIDKTCTDVKDSKLFWFLNNGVTMICDKVDVVKDADRPLIKLSNVQIVNGCQTTVTLLNALKRNVLNDEVSILVKILETKDVNLIGKITLTTNNQNKITSRDLKANDPTQILIQKNILQKYKLHYERKTKEFYRNTNVPRKHIIPNNKVGQAYLAAVLRKPAIARGYQQKIWDEHYDSIFCKSVIEDLLLSFLIHSFISSKSKGKDISAIKNEVAVYGSFHLTRLCWYQLTNDKYGTSNIKANAALINNITKVPASLNKIYNKAIVLLAKEWEKIRKKDTNPVLYFKNAASHEMIEKLISSDLAEKR